MYFMPQSGAGISRSGGRCLRAARMRAATVSGVSGAGSPILMTPKITVLSPRLMLAEAGHEALHVADVRLRDADDGQVWGYAAREACAILTKDEDVAARRLREPHGPTIIEEAPELVAQNVEILCFTLPDNENSPPVLL
jgi:predicted nuclease of predicted toxin-antitoxin system